MNNRNLRPVPAATLIGYAGQLVWKVFRFLLLLSMTFVILYPLLYMLSMALRAPEDVYDPSIVWLPRHWTLSNFTTMFDVIQYPRALGNTLLLSAGSTLIQLFICSTVGYGFARFRFRGKSVLLILLLLTIVVPPQMVSLPTYVNFRDFDIMGIGNAALGHGMGFSLLNNPLLFFILALFGNGIRSGLFILIFMQFYRMLPRELEDAALVDGCGGLRTYFRIMLPNAGNVMLMVMLFSLVWYWNDYYMTAIYMSEFKTVSTQLASLSALLQMQLSAGGASAAYDPYQIVTMEQAACLLTILPLLVLFVFTQKYFTQGIEKTGIVG